MDVHRIQAPILKRIRRRRMQRFAAEFRITPATRILDVGGTAFNWYLLPVRPDVVLLNLEPELTGGIATPFQVIAADGCELPFKDQSFDIVFCNSLIEHLPPPAEGSSGGNPPRRKGLFRADAELLVPC